MSNLDENRQTLTVIPLLHHSRRSQLSVGTVKPELSQLIQSSFEQIETTFGRLVLSSYLLDREAGIYVCPLVSVAFGYQPVSRVLAEMHDSTVRSWLALSADQRKADLQRYVSGAFQSNIGRFLELFGASGGAHLMPLELSVQDKARFLVATEATLRDFEGRD